MSNNYNNFKNILHSRTLSIIIYLFKGFSLSFYPTVLFFNQRDRIVLSRINQYSLFILFTSAVFKTTLSNAVCVGPSRGIRP